MHVQETKWCTPETRRRRDANRTARAGQKQQTPAMHSGPSGRALHGVCAHLGHTFRGRRLHRSSSCGKVTRLTARFIAIGRVCAPWLNGCRAVGIMAWSARERLGCHFRLLASVQCRQRGPRSKSAPRGAHGSQSPQRTRPRARTRTHAQALTCQPNGLSVRPQRATHFCFAKSLHAHPCACETGGKDRQTD